MHKMYISIAGMIGSGKTTLAKKLSDKLSLPIYYEKILGNEYLGNFYKDMRKYSFIFQLHLLNNRFEQQQKIIWNKNGGIQDRTIYEDSIFCKKLMLDGYIDKNEYNTYIRLFSNLSNFMKKPDIIIYLDVSPETSLKRIKLRNREYEKNIDITYLTSLHKCYLEFMDDIKNKIHMITIDYNDFIDSDKIVDMIKNV